MIQVLPLMFIMLASGMASQSLEEQMRAGSAAYHRGAIGEAVAHWQTSCDAANLTDNHEAAIDCRLNIASALAVTGQFDVAIEHLNDAWSQAFDHAPNRVSAVHCALGEMLTLKRRLRDAEDHLTKALALSHERQQSLVEAQTLNALGNLAIAQEDTDKAMARFREASDAAEQAGQHLLAAKAWANLAKLASLRDGQELAILADRAYDHLGHVQRGRDVVFILIALGQAYYNACTHDLIDPRQSLLRAHELIREAATMSAELGDDRSRSYATGQLALLYELRGRYDEALQLARRGLFYAQRAQAPDQVFEKQWQLGRIFAAKGDVEQAIGLYRQAIVTLESIRFDIAAGCGNQVVGTSFRQAVGPMFFEAADLMIRQADRTDDEQGAQQLLVESRQTLELLKLGELADYFQDDCVGLIRSRTQDVASLDPRTALVYIIPQPERTDILLTIDGVTRHVRVDATEQELVRAARALRVQLENRLTHHYIRTSRQLYDWLIRPIEPALESASIDTLVFVPDGALQTIPMAALHDGKSFLVARYALAITPGMTLLDPRPLLRNETRILMAGVSESVAGFPPLPEVPDELAAIEQRFESRKLLNGAFSCSAIENEVREHPYSIVHIASHGKFGHSAEDTFILTYDDRLTLNRLEQLIRPIRYRGQPVELLTLSACQTAAGDDRAALGLAGISIKAGARSALATLWSVNDEASTLLIDAFYEQLRDDPRISKAAALRAAQLKLISNVKYRHPCYWSPFMIIGNWL